MSGLSGKHGGIENLVSVLWGGEVLCSKLFSRTGWGSSLTRAVFQELRAQVKFDVAMNLTAATMSFPYSSP